jgi:hypothetical protein
MEKGISWQRGGHYYGYNVTQRSEYGSRSTLHVQMKFPYDKDTVYLCYALPYTYTHLMRNIVQWRDSSKYFSFDTLCFTTGGRECPVLTIKSPDIDQNCPCIFLTARIHPGESNSSFVLHGLIEFLLSGHFAAQHLLNNFAIIILPMMNIDGVVEGLYRVGLSGVDLNRIWINPDPVANPVVFHAKELLRDLSESRGVACYIDFHGHSRQNGTFIFGCPSSDRNPENSEKRLPRILSFLSDAFSWANCVFSYPRERKAAGRIVARRELGVLHSFTLETSFGGMADGPRARVLYDESIWKEIGTKCGEAIYHLLVKPVSPLNSYVEKEIALLKQWSNEEECSGDENLIVRIEEDDDFGNQFGPGRCWENDEKMGMLTMKEPQSHFVINPRMISTESPGYCNPKWDHMEFSPV